MRGLQVWHFEILLVRTVRFAGQIDFKTTTTMLSQNKLMRTSQAETTSNSHPQDCNISLASQMRVKNTHSSTHRKRVQPSQSMSRTRNFLMSAALVLGVEIQRKPSHNRTLRTVVTYNKSSHPDWPKKFENYANHIPRQNQHSCSQPDL